MVTIKKTSMPQNTPNTINIHTYKLSATFNDKSSTYKF